MPVDAVVGANWGDEGKGKVTDFLAGQADLVVRFQGGANAGHTVVNPYGKFALHLLPSGVFYPEVVNVLGPGVAFDPGQFLVEYDGLLQRGVPRPQVVISDRAQLVAPWHRLLDECEEERLGAAGFGSTRQGIAPFYADKLLKVGLQVLDLYDLDRLRRKIERALAAKNVLLVHLYGRAPLAAETMVEQMTVWAEPLRPFIRDTIALLHQALRENKRILLEGQLGALRDPDHGIYPFTTSSSTLAGYGAVGAGLPPQALDRVIAVTKAYSTCVGAGPFVTELDGPTAEELRARGGAAGEYGATTGRPRRVGFFDAVATRYGCRLQGATELALSNLDVLGYLDRIPLCQAYELDGRLLEEFPHPSLLEHARPVYETLPGWKCDLSAARSWRELPRAARDYISRIEKLIGVHVRWISVGPVREAMIRREG